MTRDWFTITRYLGIGMIGFGFLMIFFAWNGAAERDTIQQQFPYLISGGLTGLALIILGAAVLAVQDIQKTRANEDQRLQELRDTLERVAVRLEAQMPQESLDGLVVAGATSFHDPSCRLAEGRDDAERISVEEAQDRGLRACRICSPLA